MPRVDKPLLPLPRFNWMAFNCLLFASLILLILTVLLIPKSRNAPLIIILFGSGISGTLCGAMLGRKLGKTPTTRVVLSLVFALVMIVVCMGMTCLGCMFGGFKLG